MNRLNILLCASFFACTPAIFGQSQFDWQNTSNSNSFWHVPSNWLPAGVPDLLDDVRILSGGEYEVWWDSNTGDTTIHNTVISTFADVAFLNLGSTPRVHTTSSFNISAGNILVRGLDIQILGLGGQLSGSVGLGGLTLDGNHPASTSFSQSFPERFHVWENSQLNVVSGANANMFRITVDQASLVNVTGSGSILFCDELELGLNSVGIIFERAFLNVEDGATASSSNTKLGVEFASTVNVNGFGSSFSSDQIEMGVEFNDTLEISDNGCVFIQDSTTIGLNGVVDISSGGHFHFGTMPVGDLVRITGRDGTIAGNVSNQDAIFASSLFGLQGNVFDTSNLLLLNSGTLLGSASLNCSLCNTGEVRMLAGERLAFTAASGGVTNEGDVNNFGGTFDVTGEFVNCGFVVGRGLFVAGDGLINESVMAFSGTTEFLGDVFNNGQIVNTGLSTLTFVDDVANNGVEIRTSAGSNTVIFGAATGNGNYTGVGTVFFEGDLQPGNSPAQVNFEGDVVIGGSAITEIELAGTNPGQFDQLMVNGDFAAGGILVVTTIDGFKLQNGMQFEIADIGMQSSGQFFGLPQGSIVANIDGVDLTIDYTGGDGNDIVLSATNNTLLGDVNLDGIVNLLDVQPFVALISNGMYQAEADINQDGSVDLLDVKPFVGLLTGI